jgi:hypothetical protein
LEDAGQAWAERGEHSQVVVGLSPAHALYLQLGAADGMVRVRSGLRAAGDWLRHWTHADRPVGHRVLLSSHAVAFHLRHIFWKPGVTSRVQLARMAAAQASLIGDGNIPSLEAVG